MDKDQLRKVIEDELSNRNLNLDDDDIAEVADSIVEICDEEGMFEVEEQSPFLYD